MRLPVRFAIAFSLLVACSGAFAQQVTISKTSKLFAEPNPAASAVGELKEGTSAEVIGRQGAFVNVKSVAGTGWVFAFNVNFGGGAAAPAAATPQRKSPATATIGIRGLEKDDMKNATFDGKQLDALDAFADDKGGRKK